MNDSPQVFDQSGVELSASELYDIIRLRLEVFGSEQGIDWRLDFDCKDLLHTIHHLWLVLDGRIATYMRVINDGNSVKLGRVCTASASR